jgi:hypothetical protein
MNPRVAQAVEAGEMPAAMHLDPSNKRNHLLVNERFKAQIERLVAAESPEGWKPPTESSASRPLAPARRRHRDRRVRRHVLVRIHFSGRRC